jgi:hypothetical protein
MKASTFASEEGESGNPFNEHREKRDFMLSLATNALDVF